jgi:hypothetical protein
LPNIIKKTKLICGVCSKHTVLARKLERMRPLGRPRNRWEDNIKIVLRKYDGRK